MYFVFKYKKVFSAQLWLQRVLSVEVSHTCLKKCSTTCVDCSLPIESRLCVGLTESRTQHEWVVEKESDSQLFVSLDACGSTLKGVLDGDSFESLGMQMQVAGCIYSTTFYSETLGPADV